MATDSWQQHVLQHASANGSEQHDVRTRTRKPAADLRWHAPPTAVRRDRIAAGNAPAAAERLKTLRERSSERRDAMIPHIEVQEAIAERTRAQQHLRTIASTSTGWRASTCRQRMPRSSKLRGRSRRTTENARRLTERSERLAAAWRAAAQPLSNTENLLRHGMPSGVLLQDHETEMPKLLKSETVVDGIERLRRRCRELKADQHRIASAPYPSSYAKAQMRAQIEAAGDAGCAIGVASRRVGRPGLILQTQRLRSEAFGAETPVGSLGEVPDTIALVAWLHRDLLIKRLDAEIDAEADDPAALSHADRKSDAAEAQGGFARHGAGHLLR